MARPKKNNADYFPHDCDAKEDEKIVYLESLFGDSGYAWYFKMLESFARCENFEMPWSDMKCAIMARKFNADIDKFKQFVVAATTPEIDIFRCDNGMLYSYGLKKRLAVLVEKRERDAERISRSRNPEIHNPLKSEVVAATIQDVAATSTQSKVKESKVKESKAFNKKEKNAQDADFEIKNSPAESDAGSEEGSSKNTPLVPALPPQDEPVESLGGQVMDWAKRNRAQILSKSREVGLISDAQTPQQAAAEIKNAIEDWCSYHAERDAFKLDPVGLFREKYHTWFRIRAEKNASAKPGAKPRGRAAPKQDSSVSYSPEQCAAFFRSRYGFLAELYTTNHATTLAKCQTKEQFEDLLEKQYESLKAKANGNARKGPQDLSSVIGSSLPVHQ